MRMVKARREFVLILFVFICLVAGGQSLWKGYENRYPIDAALLVTDFERRIFAPFWECYFEHWIKETEQYPLEERAKAYSDYGKYFSSHSRHTDAVVPFRNSLKIYEKIYGEDNPNLIPYIDNLEDSLQRTGKDTEAITIIKCQIRLLQNPINLGSALAHKNLALALLDSERPAEALPEARKSLSYYLKLRAYDSFNNARKQLSNKFKGTSAGLQLDSEFYEVEPPSDRSDAKSNARKRWHVFSPWEILSYIISLKQGLDEQLRSVTDLINSIANTKKLDLLESNVRSAKEVKWKVNEADALDKLADHYETLGQIRMALTLREQAREILEREMCQQNFNNPCLASLLEKLQSNCSNPQIGDFGKALFYARRRCEMSENPIKSAVGQALNQLILLYHHSGQYDCAESAAEKAIDIFQRLGDKNWESLILQNWAETLWAEGRFSEAERKNIESLHLRELSGVDHASTCLPALKLGRTFVALNRPREARYYIDRSQRIRELCFKPEHAYVAYGREGVAECMIQERDYDGAMKELEMALPVIVQEHEAHSPRVAQTLQLMARCLESKWKESVQKGTSPKVDEDLMKRAENYLKTAQKLLGEGYVECQDHVELARIDASLGVFYFNRGNSALALENLARAARRYIKKFKGETHPELIKVLSTYSHITSTVFECAQCCKLNTTQSRASRREHLDSAEILLRIVANLQTESFKAPNNLRWRYFGWNAYTRYRQIIDGTLGNTLSSPERPAGKRKQAADTKALLLKVGCSGELLDGLKVGDFDWDLQRYLAQSMTNARERTQTLEEQRLRLLRWSQNNSNAPILARLMNLRKEAEGIDAHLVAKLDLDIAVFLDIYNSDCLGWDLQAESDLMKLVLSDLSQQERTFSEPKSIQRLKADIQSVLCLAMVEADRGVGTKDGVAKAVELIGRLQRALVACKVRSRDNANLLVRIAQALSDLGEFDRARNAAKVALELKPSTVDAITAFTILSRADQYLHNLTAASADALRAVQMSRNSHFESSLTCSLMGYSEILELMGDSVATSEEQNCNSGLPPKARSYYVDAMEAIDEAISIAASHRTISALDLLELKLQRGELLLKSGRFSEASSLFRFIVDWKCDSETFQWRSFKARALRKFAEASLFGPETKNRDDIELALNRSLDELADDESVIAWSSATESLRDLALLYLSYDEKTKAAAMMFKSYDLFDRYLMPRFNSMNVVQKCSLVRSFQRQADLLIDSCAESSASAANINRKSKNAKSRVARENAILGFLYFEKWQGKIRSVEALTNLKAELQNLPGEFIRYQSKLRFGETIVGFIKFSEHRLGKLPTQRYAAVCINPAGPPILFKLTESAETIQNRARWLIGSLIEKTGTKAVRPGTTQSFLPKLAEENLRSFRTAVWNDVIAFTSTAERVLVCADGSLSNVPWYLVVNSEYSNPSKRVALVCELNNFCDLPRLVDFRTRNPLKSYDYLLVGKFDYSKSGLDLLPDDVSPLERTLIEQGVHPKTWPSTGMLNRINKSQLLSQLSGPASIFISSHGALLTRDRIAADRDRIHGSRRVHIEEIDPYSLSCIVVPNCDSPEGKEYVSAAELAKISLGHCDLITLSGCETGLSEHAPMQNSMGLRTAVIDANARCALVSLWKVDAKATVKLTTEFYKNLRACNKAEALRRAQISVMSNRDEHMQHPFYWAGWTLVGIGW